MSRPEVEDQRGRDDVVKAPSDRFPIGPPHVGLRLLKDIRGVNGHRSHDRPNISRGLSSVLEERQLRLTNANASLASCSSLANSGRQILVAAARFGRKFPKASTVSQPS